MAYEYLITRLSCDRFCWQNIPRQSQICALKHKKAYPDATLVVQWFSQFRDRFSILAPYVPQKWYIWISFVVIYKTLSYQQIYSKQTFFRFQTCLHRWKCKHVWFSQFRMIFPVPGWLLKEAQNRGLNVRKCQCLHDIYFLIFIHLKYFVSRSVNNRLSY